MTKDEYTPDLELDENEIQDAEVDTEETSDESTTEDKDWKAEALKFKAILDRNKNKTINNEKTEKKSESLGYGEKAFLTSNGIKGQKEFDFVQKELKASGQNLDELIENDYFQSKLEKFRSINKTSDAIPKGSRANNLTTDSIDYWLAKPIEEVPKEMRSKVVEEKIKRESVKGVFYNS